LLRLRSRALDRLGTAEATRTRSLDEGDAPIAAWSLAPVIEPADRIGLREAVGRLEASVREVLELTYFRGLTAPAIAEQTNVPVGTVRSRLARGLRQLRAALDTSFTTAVLESDGKIDHTYFRATAPPCSGATSANEPVLAGDYFASGKASIDPGCAQIGTTATGSATATLPGAGPVGL
jgi:hypothetical protein